MKKILVFTVICTLVFLMTACRKKDDSKLKESDYSPQVNNEPKEIYTDDYNILLDIK